MKGDVYLHLKVYKQIKMIKLNNGYYMPKLGLGTFLMTEEEVMTVIPEALKVGYKHIDTAQMYNNEKAIGKALKASGIKRNKYFITSKLMYHHSINKTKELIEQSLKDLQTNYIDLFLIHWPSHNNEINIRTWQVLEEYYEKGIFKAIGVSNFTRYQLTELLKEAKIKPAVNQVEMHPALTQEPLKDFLDNLNIQMISYGPLMRGGVFESPYLESLNEIAQKYNSTIPQLVIAWGLKRNIMMIPKTSSKQRLKENYNALNVNITNEDMLKINSLNRGRRVYTDPANTIHNKLIE